MNCIKKSMACAMAVGCAMLATATPEVSNVTMTQSAGSRLVTITYKLTEDAVVTLDVLTNATPNAATGWASIGGKAICNAQGAVWRKVTSADADGSGNYTITWRPDNSWTDEFGNGFKSPIVGTYRPNKWGLYDMHGNVWEVCLDWYKEDIGDLNGEVCNDNTGGRRVRRGGAWNYYAGSCRSASRNSSLPTARQKDNGLRVVCTAGLK